MNKMIKFKEIYNKIKIYRFNNKNNYYLINKKWKESIAIL